ncbi:MAG: tetratricopeptide repeat protein [Alphaproteobacteria bacterium]|nr:tetratricopeptide repeat protein [Alphaproteobacteria bacterium]
MTEPTPHPADPEASFRAALAKDPNDRQALLGLAGLLKLQERPQEALVLSEDVLGREPRHGEAWLTRGDALFNLDRYGDAVESCRRAFIRRDLAYDALMRLGQAFSAMGRCDLVIESLDAAVTLRPDSGDARLRRAWLRLKFGQYAEGWEGLRAALALRAVRGRLARGGIAKPGPGPYDRRDSRRSGWQAPAPGGRTWDRRSGDVRQHDPGRRAPSGQCRMRVRGAARPALPVVLSGRETLSPATAQVDSEDIDLVMAMGSLGPVFRCSASDVTAEAYLHPAQDVVRAGAERLGPRRGRLRVGLSWRGGVPATRRRARSIPLAALAEMLDLPDCEFISLQYDDAPAEVAAVNAGRAAPIRTLPEEATRDFEELAALVAKLDVWSLGAYGRRSSLRRAWNAVSDPCPAGPGVALWAQAPATPWYRSVRLFPSPRRARGRRRSRRSPRSFAVAFLSAPSGRGLRHDGPSRR